MSEFFKMIAIIAVVLICYTANAQVAINTDGSSADNAAILDLKSTEKGFLPPRMTTAQRNAISSPPEGLIIYNTDSTCIEFWGGASWFDICTGNTYTPPATVLSAGVYWMDRNLGASQVADSSTDAAAYGDLYQWGRASDGHELRTSGTTSTLSTTDTPGHANFIITSGAPYDWRSPSNDNLWQGASGTNNPCPAGFRLPTETELDYERQSWSLNNAAGAYVSPLKLSVTGGRFNDGSFSYVGSFGYYWNSSLSGVYPRTLVFLSSNAFMNHGLRSDGKSIRCLKD